MDVARQGEPRLASQPDADDEAEHPADQHGQRVAKRHRTERPSHRGDDLDAIVGALDRDTLLRIDDDEYGPCQNCEKAINPKRLAAIPWARYCIECQELVEKGLLDDE